MRKKRLIILGLIITFLALLGVTQAQANTPLNVGLRSFTGTALDNAVRLDWITETELNTAGFKIKRSTGTSQNFVTLDNIGIVPSTGGVATGASYSVVDDTAVNGQIYTYKLVEVRSDTTEEELATVTVSLEPTPTPIVILTNNPTVSSTNTAVPTSTATRTPTPSNTNPPTATVTVTPGQTGMTNTPTATIVSPMTAVPLVTATQNGSATLDAPSSTTAGDSGNTVLAQEQAETPEPGYPGPVDTEAGSGDAGGYPANQSPSPSPTPENPTPYPITADDDNAAPPTLAVIGNQENAQPVNAAPTVAPGEVLRGRAFLWAGFIIALLIFIFGVIGAIIFYRRRPE